METVPLEVIQSWLKELYGDDPVPQFEITDDTLLYLNRLFNKCKKAQESSAKTIEDLKTKSNEIAAEKRRLQNILNEIGINPSNLSNDSQHTLRLITSLASALSLQDVSLTSFVLAVTDLKLKEMSVSQKLSSEKLITKELKQKTLASMHKNSLLKQLLADTKALVSEEQKSMDNHSKEISYLKQKNAAYEKDIKQTSQSQKDVGFTGHDEICKLLEEYKSLHEKVNECQKQLESCKDLPPDERLAKVELLNAINESEKLEMELLKKTGLASS